MIKAIVVDDESNARESLINMIKLFCKNVEVCGEGKNIDEAQELINAHHPDVVFLDIEMPHGNGFQLLERFDSIPFQIIFTTAYDQYAIKAIKFSALDYLLKPIDHEELQLAVEKVNENRGEEQSSHKFETLKQNLNQETHLERIVVPDSDGLVVLELSDIVRCESDSNYTFIHLTTKKKIIVAKTLRDFEEMLSTENFTRVHRSHLINMKHVKKYIRGEGGSVIMSDGSEVEISRRKKPEFMEALERSV